MLYLWLFAAGVVQVAAYPFFMPVWLALAAAGLLLISRRRFTGPLACLCVGIACGSWNLQRWCAAQLDPSFEQRSFDLHFQIISIPQQNPHSAVFLAKVIDLRCGNGDCPDLDGVRIRLAWYRPTQRVEPGQEWRAQVKLRRPRGFVNPDGFDYHAWLLAQRVMATGYIAHNAQPVGQSYTWAGQRAALNQALLPESGPSTFRRFWSALLIGEQGGISQSDWTTLQATGTVHLLVISGLHIGLVAGWCFFLGAAFARLVGLFHRGSNMLLMHFVPPALACAGAGFYAALAGFSIPTLRALVACVALMLARVLGLNLSPLTLLGVGVLVVGLSEPFAWQSAGFWLSFLAVAVLFYSFSGRRTGGFVATLLRSQLVLTVGLLLPLLSLGQGASLVSPLANLVAVPLVSLVLVPLLLIAALANPLLPSLSTILIKVMDWIFNGLWRFLEGLQNLPTALWGSETALWWPETILSALGLLVAVVGVLLLLAPAGLHLRLLGIIWLSLALLARPTPDYRLRLTVMDVGQGTAVVVQTPSRTWLYDAGPQFSEQFDTGSRIVAPYLRSLGVRRINMVISHGDLDHAGGAAGVADAVVLERLLYGEPLAALPDQGQPCRAGQKWEDEGVTWQVLWPPDDIRNGNNQSCVLLLTLQTADAPVRILLPGDVDRHTEAHLLEQLDQPVNWVLAAHHGSNTSSSLAFVQRVAAGHVVFSSGFNNRYGHPHPRVVQRWQDAGAQLYNTATDGALIFTWRDTGLEVSRTRQSERKPWY